MLEFSRTQLIHLSCLGVAIVLAGTSCTRKSEPAAVTTQYQWSKLYAESKKVDGTQPDLEALRGRIVVINFWASWCPPCMEEMPSLLKAMKRYRDSTSLIAVGEDSALKDAKTFLSLFPLAKEANVNVIFDGQRKWSEQFGVHQFPETFVFDRNLKLVEHFAGKVDFSSPEFEVFFKKIIGTKTD